jgi:hypothetical protein
VHERIDCISEDKWQTTLKKHVDVDHSAFMRKLAKDLTIVSTKAPLDQQANKKKAHVSPSTISTHVGFQENLMLFMVKKPLPMKFVESI